MLSEGPSGDLVVQRFVTTALVQLAEHRSLHSRPVVDLADVAPWEEVRGAVDALRWFSPAALRSAQAGAPGRAGRGVVTRLLGTDEAPTKSELERR